MSIRFKISFLKIVFSTALVFLFGCTHVQRASDSDDLYLMSFNVENLFNTEHDQGKDDYAFLPVSKKKSKEHQEFCAKIKVRKWKDECLYKDWTEEKLKEKLKRLAETILQFNPGKGPDVLFLQEVENKGVLDRLNQEYLGGLYKEVILLEGDDKRGIDVAIMSKLPLHRKPILHKIPFKFDDPKRGDDTRGILEADLKMPDGSLLIVFSLHFPNPAHPADLRSQALEHLDSLAKPYKNIRYVVAAGDFNITSEEDSALRRTEEMSKDWMVSHNVGCKGCVGTYFYKPKNNWSFLDWMLFSQNLNANQQGWFLDTNSVQVLKGNSKQADKEGRPISFEDPKEPMGVSDHFPVGAILRKATHK